MTTTVESTILELFEKEPWEHEDVEVSQKTGLPQSICIMGLRALVAKGGLRDTQSSIFIGNFYAPPKNPKYNYIRELTRDYGHCLEDLIGAAKEGLISRHQGFVDALQVRREQWASKQKKRGKK